MSSTPKRLGFLALWLCLVLVSCPGFAAGNLEVIYLDVGQGDCEILRTPSGRTIMIDAGDDRFNVTTNAIIPFLKKAGITKIDTFVISHPHRDHFGGLVDLIGKVPIGEVLYSADMIDPNDPESGGADMVLYQKMKDMLAQEKIAYNQAEWNQKLKWDPDLDVEVLHAAELTDAAPRPAVASAAPSAPKINANNLSLIIKVVHGKNSFLFTGDAEDKAEQTTLEKNGAKLRADVLKSGHHGSKTSSSRPFIEKVEPKYAVISVGTKNSFGHPNKEILDAYEYYKMAVYRTDKDGTVKCTSDGTTVRFDSNSSPLAISEAPKIIALSGNAATIQWGTNVPANTEIHWGTSALDQHKVIANAATTHLITVSGLKPGTSYKFQVVSRDARDATKVVAAEGTFATPAGAANTPRISKLNAASTVYVRQPIQVAVNLTNPGSAAKNLKLVLYHTGIAASNALASVDGFEMAANGTVKKTTSVTIDWTGPVELIAALYMGNQLIDTTSVSTEVKPMIVLVDAAHGNIDYYTGRFAGLKMDIARNLGMECRSSSKAMTAESLAEAFVVIIPDPQKEFTAAELTALKGFVAKGGSLYLFCRAEYNDRAHPETFNAILGAVGSRIRFQGDEVCDPTENIGPPYAFFSTKFPSTAIQGVQKLLCRSCCSLINDKNGALTAQKGIELFATGDADSYNIDVLGQGRVAYYYASNSATVVIGAGEDLGTGRVACVGETLYEDKLYNDPKTQQAAQYNRSVIAWLAAARFRPLREMLSLLADGGTGLDPEICADRQAALRARCEKVLGAYIDANQVDLIADVFTSHSSPEVKSLQRGTLERLQFKAVHGESSTRVQQVIDKWQREVQGSR